jgi:hypothetical protein
LVKHFDVAERLTGAVLENSGLFETGNIPGTDIPAFGPLQNKSGHGIDWLGKARTGKYAGEYVPIEVKAGLRGRAPGLSSDQAKGAESFARSRVERAYDGKGQWGPNATPAGTQEFAKSIRQTMADQRYNGFVISHNYLGVPSYKGDRVTITKW